MTWILTIAWISTGLVSVSAILWREYSDEIADTIKTLWAIAMAAIFGIFFGPLTVPARQSIIKYRQHRRRHRRP